MHGLPLKAIPKIEWRDRKPENFMMGRVRLTLIEDHGDVKAYEATDKALCRKRRVKKRKILELQLTTSDEGFARSVAELPAHHGTVYISGTEIVKKRYNEWTMTIH